MLDIVSLTLLLFFLFCTFFFFFFLEYLFSNAFRIIRAHLVNHRNVFTVVVLDYWLANLDVFAKNDPAKCPKNCGRSYKGTHRKKVLRRHLVYECGVERKFMCTICFRRFSQKYYLSTHMGSVHRVAMN